MSQRHAGHRDAEGEPADRFTGQAAPEALAIAEAIALIFGMRALRASSTALTAPEVFFDIIVGLRLATADGSVIEIGRDAFGLVSCSWALGA